MKGEPSYWPIETSEVYSINAYACICTKVARDINCIIRFWNMLEDVFIGARGHTCVSLVFSLRIHEIF